MEKVQAIAMNPPYSLKYSADEMLSYDPRFTGFHLAPPSKADFMFVLDAFHRLEEHGRLAVLLPHGVLFRGNAEFEIRKQFLENGYIDSIIGLPPNLFSGTAIPTVVLILRKDKKDKSIFVMDASDQFEKGKPTNILTAENLKTIKDAWIAREDIKKLCKNITFEKLQENEFNLNIPRYVDKSDPKPPVDIRRELEELKQIDIEIEQTRREVWKMAQDLVVTTGSEEKESELTALIDMFTLPDFESIPDKIIEKIEEVAEEKGIKKMDKETGLPTPEYQQLVMDFMDELDSYTEAYGKRIDKLKKGKEFALDNMFPNSSNDDEY